MKTIKTLIDALLTLTEEEQGMSVCLGAPSIFGGIYSWGEDKISILVEKSCGVVTIRAVATKEDNQEIEVFRHD